MDTEKLLKDKELECIRYDQRAKKWGQSNFTKPKLGSLEIDPVLRAPYIDFEGSIRQLVKECDCVLEIGSGVGMHTGLLLTLNASVIASDISEFSLNVLKTRYRGFENLQIKVADMEDLPFPNSSFDVITCAGSLSYGDNDIVLSEVHRLLKDGGYFICVDSLAHNPIYKFNRWLHYLRGERTHSTLVRMPSMKLIKAYATAFGTIETKYFGAISWLMPILKLLIGADRAAAISEKMDMWLKVDRFAFKFVMVVRKGKE